MKPLSKARANPVEKPGLEWDHATVPQVKKEGWNAASDSSMPGSFLSKGFGVGSELNFLAVWL